MRVTRRHFFFGALAGSAFGKEKKRDKKDEGPRPNVLLVVAEDLGAWMLGCYGNQEIRTPRIDHFAKLGTQFTGAYAAAPVAAAGRAALLTGRFSGGTPVAGVLSGAGYQCSEVPLAEAAQALARQKPGTPFLLTASHSVARGKVESRHVELYAQAKFETTGWESSPSVKDPVGESRKVAAAVSTFDELVGEALKQLHAGKLQENTVVVLTAASGWLLGQHGLWGDGSVSNPPNLFEQTVRVPLIWSWYGRTPPGVTRPDLVSALDLVPSLCELAGVPPPAGVCGRGMLALVRNQPLPKKNPWRSTVVARMGATGMARDHRYKAVLRPDGSGEVYDLVVDPREKTNQFDNQQFLTVRTRLSAAWQDWNKRCPA